MRHGPFLARLVFSNEKACRSLENAFERCLMWVWNIIKHAIASHCGGHNCISMSTLSLCLLLKGTCYGPSIQYVTLKGGGSLGRCEYLRRGGVCYDGCILTEDNKLLKCG